MCALEKYKCSNTKSVYFALLKTYREKKKYKEEIKLRAKLPKLHNRFSNYSSGYQREGTRDTRE